MVLLLFKNKTLTVKPLPVITLLLRACYAVVFPGKLLTVNFYDLTYQYLFLLLTHMFSDLYKWRTGRTSNAKSEHLT